MQSCQLSLEADPLRHFCVKGCNLKPHASGNKSSGMAHMADVKGILAQMRL